MPGGLRSKIGTWVGDWVGFGLPPVSRVLDELDRTVPRLAAACPRCGGSTGHGESTPNGCSACRGHAVLVDRVVRLGPHAGVLRQCVHAIKYDRWHDLGERLGERLGRTVALSSCAGAPTVVVPMPMPWQRRLYRGIDHSGVIADGVSRHLGAPVARVLSRANGAPQVSRSASDRRRAGGRGLGLRRRRAAVITGVHVVLVDDVLTTGASLRAAARLIRECRPGRITAAVLAVADDPWRRTVNSTRQIVQIDTRPS